MSFRSKLEICFLLQVGKGGKGPGLFENVYQPEGEATTPEHRIMALWFPPSERKYVNWRPKSAAMSCIQREFGVRYKIVLCLSLTLPLLFSRSIQKNSLKKPGPFLGIRFWILLYVYQQKETVICLFQRVFYFRYQNLPRIKIHRDILKGPKVLILHIVTNKYLEKKMCMLIFFAMVKLLKWLVECLCKDKFKGVSFHTEF